MNKQELLNLDTKYNWHPCTLHKQISQKFNPFIVEKAYDCYLELPDGSKIIDAISSW